MCQNIGIQATVNKLKQVMQRFFVYSLRFTLTPTNKKQVFSGNISDFNLSISYNKVLEIEENIAGTQR